jgi:catechol 2,3-dioxygenase-like lactoylglutathione lyase family enzyme
LPTRFRFELTFEPAGPHPYHCVDIFGQTIVRVSQDKDLLNDVTQERWPVRVAFFRGPDGELIELLEDKTGYTQLKQRK